MTQDRNEWIYDALTELAGLDTHDVNLRDNPKAYEVLGKLLDEPIDMVLFCPKCGTQHVDAPEIPELDRGGLPIDPTTEWVNPPHRSHLCHGCGHVWRPADVPTNGVAAVKTTGKADSPIPEALK